VVSTTGSDRRRAVTSAGPWIAALAVGLLALGACLWRLMPGLGFWDTAEFQMVLPLMGTAHPTGYPTYVLIGWLAGVLLQPLGEAALRMNVLSAILVAVGAGFSVDLARRVSGSLIFGLAAGIGIALTPIVWAVGTHADPHALHFALLAIILWLLVRWEGARQPLAPAGDEVGGGDAPVEPTAAARRADRLLLAAAVVVGVSVGNHSLTLLLGPPILLFVWKVEPGIFARRRFVAACVAAFAIPTVLIRFEMILRAGWFRAPFVYADPSTWGGFWYITLGQQFHDWFTNPLADWPKRIADLAAMGANQLGPLAPLVLVAFVVTAVRRRNYAILTGTLFAITCFFNSVYPDGAIDRYYIGPALLAWTWLAILGSSAVDVVLGFEAGRLGGERAAAAAGLALVLAALLLAPTAGAFAARAQAVDRTGDRAAERWTDEVLSVLEPNAVVVSWWSYSTPLWYATIVDGRRPDITIIDDRTRVDCNLLELAHVIDLYLPTHPVYLIRNGTSELPALVGRFQVDPIGAPIATNVLRVLPLTGSSEGAPGSAPEPPRCPAIQS
jgi:hypothetical protein